MVADAWVDNLRDRIDGLNGDLTDAQRVIVQAKAYMDTLRSRIDGLNGDVADLKADLAAEIRYRDYLRGRIDTLNGRILDLERDLASASAAGSTLTYDDEDNLVLEMSDGSQNIVGQTEKSKDAAVDNIYTGYYLGGGALNGSAVTFGDEAQFSIKGTQYSVGGFILSTTNQTLVTTFSEIEDKLEKAFNQGYDDGYGDGYDDGYADGYADGAAGSPYNN